MSVLATEGWVKARLDVVHERLDEMKAENAAFAFFLGERECENRKAHEELSLKVESLSKEFANDNFSITQRLNAIEGLNRMHEWIVRNINNLYQRLDALEASTRGWTEKGEVQAVNDRLEALEARVALCGGISETKPAPRPVLTTEEGEGPLLRNFVNWLSANYAVSPAHDLYETTTKEQLIGEYLVYRAGFGRE